MHVIDTLEKIEGIELNKKLFVIAYFCSLQAARKGNKPILIYGYNSKLTW
jgi:hypothetical protein